MRAEPAWREVPGVPVLQAGTDEAGRGCLAGDVVAAAVILDPSKTLSGLNDSKKLTPARREQCYRHIVDSCLSYAIGRASAVEIDRLNILKASLLAMHRAVEQLSIQPEFVYVDGNFCPNWPYPAEAVIGGDGCIRAIAAASILAKVARDREMVALDREYPGYGFALHKGYPTSDHLDVLSRLGPSPVHRRTFGPVAELC